MSLIRDQFKPTLHEYMKVSFNGNIQIIQEKDSDLFEIFFCDGDKKIAIDVDGNIDKWDWLNHSSKTLTEDEIQLLINKLQICLKENK